MKNVALSLSFLLLSSLSQLLCAQTESPLAGRLSPKGATITERFPPPPGYERVLLTDQSFGAYLRQLPIKPHGAMVHYYNGSIKTNHGVYAAVIDREIGSNDLHQCADAVIRLRAEYLWEQGQPEQIHFSLTNGWRMEYSAWLAGKQFRISGNKTWWEPGEPRANTEATLWEYLQVVFNYAGTYSLHKELQKASPDEMQVGDMFIRGGFPGHVMLVADMAVNPATGHRVFLLIQSYMPAQELQVVWNPASRGSSVWYPVDFGATLYTPEWTFSRTEFRRFR